MRIDPHVHLRDEEQNYKETIAHGLTTAKKAGVDYVFDMPNTQRPILTKKDVERRLGHVPEGEKGRYFLYIGATADAAQLKDAANLVEKIKEVIGIKMFAGKSTGTLEITDEAEQRNVYQTLADCGYQGVLAVHCEKESYITDTFDSKNPITHATSRPDVAEVESVKDQLRFAKETGFGGTLHICHASTKKSVELVDEARKEMKITCGVTPHHLLWDDSRMNDDHGLLYKMNPPLRSKEDVEALRGYLKEGKIDWIETDHAPHTVGEKLYDGYPSGFPSLYLYKELVEEFLPKWGLSEEQIEDITYNNIVKTFNLEIGG